MHSSSQADGGAIQIYVDGSPDGSASAEGAWSFSDQNLLIGQSPDAYWEEYAGDIDEVQIYNIALTADEIAYLAQNPGNVKLAGDLNIDGSVDKIDLEAVANQWLGAGGTPDADIAPAPDGDGIVDLMDFATLAQDWLE